jgi:hypothetical protein
MITARSSPVTSGASKEEASVCESAPKAVIVIEASSVSRAENLKNFLRDWPREPVYKKQAYGQVNLFLCCESRQVFLEQAFYRAAFPTGRSNRTESYETESQTGFLTEQGSLVELENLSVIFLTCFTFLFIKILFKNPI